MKLDHVDKKLISLLQNDSKQTSKQLSLQLNLSVTAVYERIKKLINNKTIVNYPGTGGVKKMISNKNEKEYKNKILKIINLFDDK